MTNYKEIGIINSLTQLVAFGILSGGAVFLLPLAFAENTGWVMLILWIGLNFLGLPMIVKLTDKILEGRAASLDLRSELKILLTGLLGAVLAYILNLVYYRFHMHYIDKEFDLSDYKSDFVSIVATMTMAIIVGEFVRRKRKKTVINNSDKA